MIFEQKNLKKHNFSKKTKKTHFFKKNQKSQNLVLEGGGWGGTLASSYFGFFAPMGNPSTLFCSKI